MLVDEGYIVLFLRINLAGTEWGKIAKAIMIKDIKVVKIIKTSVSIFGTFGPMAILYVGINVSYVECRILRKMGQTAPHRMKLSRLRLCHEDCQLGARA